MDPIFKKLRPYTWAVSEEYAQLCKSQGIVNVCQGRRGAVAFICTQDFDGQIEVSLTKHDPQKRAGQKTKPVSQSAARKFFDVIGEKPIEECCTRTIRHFVVRVGGYIQ